MGRNNRIYRAGSSVVVVIDTIEHRISEPAFLDLLTEALPIAERLAAEQDKRRAAIAAETKGAR
jgi:hypothetical protein